MKVLVDTCIWSKALRRKASNPEIITSLADLIYDGRVTIIGPIRQEILSGISNINQFNKLKEHLSSFEDILLMAEYYVKAAEFSNHCRKNGIQGSAIDFLICAVSNMNKLLIYTDDKDFLGYAKYLPIKLYQK